MQKFYLLCFDSKLRFAKFMLHSEFSHPLSIHQLAFICKMFLVASYILELYSFYNVVSGGGINENKIPL